MRIYGFVILLGAFLLFQMQPLLARYLTPAFGGSAKVWSLCLVFFQTFLLLGYLYAHWLHRWSNERTGSAYWKFLHFMLLGTAVVGIGTSQLIPQLELAPDLSPEWRIFLILLATAGLPYFILATTNPLLQAWYNQKVSGADNRIYRLYGLSNLGSLLGLMSYPILIEPFLPLATQSMLWSAGFILYTIFLAHVVWQTRQTAQQAVFSDETPKIQFKQYALWFILAAIPSALLIAVTQHITQNVAPIPLLWVVPLALYLVSFILPFSFGPWRTDENQYIIVMMVMFLAAVVLFPGTNNIPFFFLISIWLVALLLVGLLAHGSLALYKPPPAQLTPFYLTIAAGGAAGGIAITLLAPLLFQDYYELPLLIFIAGIIAWWRYRQWCDGLIKNRNFFKILGIIAIAALAAVLAFGQIQTNDKMIAQARNLYGSLKVVERQADGHQVRMLIHGSIMHGFEFIDDTPVGRGTGYYNYHSGFARAYDYMARKKPDGLNVGVIGLGAGVMANYKRPQDYFTFYEINPLVAQIATSQFHYLKSRNLAKLPILIGDARHTLETQADQQFDLLIIDAFSSDSIPIHLLTKEAFDLYKRHLTADGVLVVHISNRYVDLTPVIATAAQYLQQHALDVFDDPRINIMNISSNFAIISPNDLSVEPEFKWGAERTKIHSLQSTAQDALWTDQYSSILPLFRWDMVFGKFK